MNKKSGFGTLASKNLTNNSSSSLKGYGKASNNTSDKTPTKKRNSTF